MPDICGQCQCYDAYSRKYLNHGGGRACHSDWSENSFVMFVYKEKIFSRALDRKFS